jgi:Flp pilus assembly pilin Flp
MDKLRAAAADVAERAARSRPLMSWSALTARFDTSDDNNQGGQGLAEYALILALIAIVAIASLIFLGNSVIGMFEDIINNGFRYVQEVLAT